MGGYCRCHFDHTNQIWVSILGAPVAAGFRNRLSAKQSSQNGSFVVYSLDYTIYLTPQHIHPYIWEA